MKKGKLHLIVGIGAFLIAAIVLLFFVPTPNVILSEQALRCKLMMIKI